jgi:hypothetical protein
MRRIHGADSVTASSGKPVMLPVLKKPALEISDRSRKGNILEFILRASTVWIVSQRSLFRNSAGRLNPPASSILDANCVTFNTALDSSKIGKHNF